MPDMPSMNTHADHEWERECANAEHADDEWCGGAAQGFSP
jgi:hypothetical protein